MPSRFLVPFTTMTSSLEMRLSTFRSSGLAVLRDETGRAILVAGAENVSSATLNRMIALSGGIVFATISAARAAALLIPPMQSNAISSAISSANGYEILSSVEAREGVTTGISVSDRCATIRALNVEPPHPRLIVRPGHIFPVRVAEGGILVRGAHPEGAHDLVRLALDERGATFIDLLDANGDFFPASSLEQFCSSEALPAFTLEEVVRLRLEQETLVFRHSESSYSSEIAGDLRSVVYRTSLYEGEHVALIKGDLAGDDPILTRVQPEFTFSDIFGGDTPPSRRQLHGAMTAIGARGRGVLVYLRRPRVSALRDQVRDWQGASQRKGSMTREYGLGAQILRDLGVRRIELITSSKKSLSGLVTFGIQIVSQHPLSESP